MDNLFWGNLFPPPFSEGRDWPPVYPAPLRQINFVFDSGQSDHDSGIRTFVIGIVPESRSPSSRNPDRFHPGTMITFIPDR
jgi:hypothetical protein